MCAPVQPLRHLGDDANRLRLGNGAVALDPLAERLAVNELHDEVRGVSRLAVVDGADDVGVVEPAGGAELLLEALQQDGIARHVRGHDLDGDDLSGGAVAALPDGAHAAFGDLFEQVVVADGLHRGPGKVRSHRCGPRRENGPHDRAARSDRPTEFLSPSANSTLRAASGHGKMKEKGERTRRAGSARGDETSACPSRPGNAGNVHGPNHFACRRVQKRLASTAPFCHNPFIGRRSLNLPAFGRPVGVRS